MSRIFFDTNLFIYLLEDDGQRGSKLAAGMRAQAKRAFARLEDGLADYAVRRPRRPGSGRAT